MAVTSEQTTPHPVAQSVKNKASVQNLILSLVCTALSGPLAYACLAKPALLGIDYAIITQIYGRNLALGTGYVFQIGGERVEGSTSLLWTLINALAFKVFAEPRVMLIVTTTALTIFCVYAALEVGASVYAAAESETGSITPFLLVFISGSIPFFAWCIFTLMDVALWAAAFLAAVRVHLTWLTSRTERRTLFFSAVAVGVILVLARPEGGVIAGGLTILTLFLDVLENRGLKRDHAWLGASFFVIILVFGAVAAFRVGYFGVPFPNTYYAKVSSDLVANVYEGTRYFRNFLVDFPFASASIVAWCGLSAWCARAAIMQGAGNPTFATAVLFVSGSITMVLAGYIVLGGDHFGMFRFYQPVVLLLPMPLAFAVKVVSCRVNLSEARGSIGIGTATLLGAGLVLAVGVAYVARESKGTLQKEFRVAREGEIVGLELNALFPDPAAAPSVGTAAAGGLAMTYAGKVYDLMGLNWVAMAHANKIKIGVRNHGGFEKSVFWQTRPDLVVPWLTSDDLFAPWLLTSFDSSALKGLQFDPDFRQSYEPVVFAAKHGHIRAFALRDWLRAHDVRVARRIPWDQVILIDR